MKNGKFAKRGVSTKAFAMILAIVALVSITVGGTLAWLTDTADEVVNTFSPSTINIELDESDDLDLTMVPGFTIAKDPWAKVETGSEDCWLFVVIEESDNYDDFMAYEVAAGWEPVEGEANVYARKVLAANMGTEFPILKDDTVTVKTTVTKAMMDELTTETYPTLSFKAYAVQLYSSNNTEFTAAQAWAQTGA